MRFDHYIEEIKSCFQQLNQKVQNAKQSILRQNEAHGLMIRINIFIKAYFTYRQFYQSLNGSTSEEQMK